MAIQAKPQSAAPQRGLEAQGLTPSGTVHWNLMAPVLVEQAVARGEGSLADMGPFVARTSPHTGRSPNDKFVVQEPASMNDVDWGKVNQPFSEEKFAALLQDVRAYLDERESLYVQDLYCGADPAYRLAVRYVSPSAWHMNFVRNMFIRPEPTELPTFTPNFTVLHAPEFEADPARHGTRTSTFIVLNLKERIILIGGTRYAGELKKSMFTVMNYYLPKQGVLSMHCSANTGPGGDTAVFSGLSSDYQVTALAGGGYLVLDLSPGAADGASVAEQADRIVRALSATPVVAPARGARRRDQQQRAAPRRGADSPGQQLGPAADVRGQSGAGPDHPHAARARRHPPRDGRRRRRDAPRRDRPRHGARARHLPPLRHPDGSRTHRRSRRGAPPSRGPRARSRRRAGCPQDR